MAAVLPRKFIPHQLRFRMDQTGQLTAQLIQLQNPWDRHARVLEVASTPPKVPPPQAQQVYHHHHHQQQQQQQQEHPQVTAASEGYQAEQQQHQQRPRNPKQLHTHATRHTNLDPWSPMPPGLMHPLSHKQLRANRFLAPPFVLQADLAQCRAAGQKLAAKVAQIVAQSASQNAAGMPGGDSLHNRPRRLLVGAELPDPVAHHPQLLAVLRALEESGGGAVQVVRSVVKAKVLQHR